MPSRGPADVNNWVRGFIKPGLGLIVADGGPQAKSQHSLPANLHLPPPWMGWLLSDLSGCTTPRRKQVGRRAGRITSTQSTPFLESPLSGITWTTNTHF